MNTAEKKEKRTLQILDNESSLKSSDQFHQRLRWDSDSDSQQPRALRALGRIVDGGLCHRCGSCVGICPTGVLRCDDNEYPEVSNLSACTDCDLCVKVCPGDEFNYSHHVRERYEKDPQLEDTHGHYKEALVAYSKGEPGLRESSTSGGLVTAVLLHLIDTGAIDGAVVIASDDTHLWKGKPIIARTREEILAATKSKYAISPTNTTFAEIRKVPGRYALVGLPCQIHGYVKAAELDARLKERIVLTIGLFCHAAIEHEAFEIIWESLGSHVEGATKFISRIGKHPGAPHLQYEDGSTYPVYFGDKQGFRPSSMEVINVLYRLYTPARCLTCFDALAEFADISVGDPWMAPPEDDIDFHDGWSFGLVRSEIGVEVVNQLKEKESIAWRSVTPKEAHRCNHHMATEKRWRAFRMIETHQRQGKAIPSYGTFGMKLPSRRGKQFFLTECNMLTHVGCFLKRQRGTVLRFFLGNGGYSLLWINNKRRRLKVFLRDSYARAKRKIFGRS